MADKEYLHGDDAGIIGMLPALASDLVSHRSYTQQLLDQIEQQLDQGIVSISSTNEQLRLVYQQLASKHANNDIPAMQTGQDMYYVIEENKSIMLNLVFGSLYQEAMEMYVSQCIDVIVYSKDNNVAVQLVVEEYFRGEYTVPVVIKVYEKGKPKTRGTLLDLTSQLENLGLRITKGWELVNFAKPAEPTVITGRGEPVIVDLKTWYCSCDGAKPTTGTLESAQSLFANYPDSKEIGVLKAIFDSNMRTECKYPTPLPICCHLLAMIIAAFNTYPGYTVKTTTNVHDLY